MADFHYLSPFRYSDTTSLRWTSPVELHVMDIIQKFEDSTLSMLDHRIMQILYRVHYASRNAIERELRNMQNIRMPRDLKRTLRHLITEGVVRGFAPLYIKDDNANIRFYCLSPVAVSYLSERGGTTDLSYEEEYSTQDMCSILAYNQLADAMIPTFGKGVHLHERRKRIYGADGTLVIDGYMELARKEHMAYLYIIVVRGCSNWKKRAGELYNQLARYTEGIQDRTCLFLCEDNEMVKGLSEHMNQKYPELTLRRFFTYDTLIFEGQLLQRVIVCEGSSMSYGSLVL